PELQQRGLGSYLLQKVGEEEKLAGIDMIGSSFSATQNLLCFWNKAGFSMLRMGFSRDHVTAAHSAVVVKALNAEGGHIARVLAEKFQRNLRLWLKGPLSDLSAEVRAYLLTQLQGDSDKVSEQDRLDIRSFALFNRNYEACMPAITRWIEKMDVSQSTLNERDRDIIGSCVGMNQWSDVVKELGLRGRGQAVQQLRIVLKRLLESED
ncbi:hypothetical protein MNBD_GAMMA11-887, partial [hydrothermal vent metagenome]